MTEKIIKNLAIPYIESPFFRKIFSDKSHPWYKYASELNENGYAIIKNNELFSTEEIADKIVNTIHDHYEGNNIPGRLQDFAKLCPQVDQVSNHPKILDLLEYLYGRKAFPFQTLHFSKGTQQHFHADAVHFNSIPERYMCGVWFALEDIDETQGPLVYYPKSHKFPIYENEHIGVDPINSPKIDQKNYELLWEELVEAAEIEPKIFLANKGDILIWSANLLHGGAKQIDQTKSRFSQVTHYYFDDCTYYVPMESDKRQGFLKTRINESSDNYNGSLQKKRKKIVDEFRDNYQSLIFQVQLPKDFNPKLYLKLNNDIKDSGMDPTRHYVLYGRDEGRPYK